MEQTEMPEQVKISFQLTRAEYVRAVRYYLRKSHLVSWIQVLVLVLALAAAAALTVLMERMSLLTSAILALALMVAGYGGYLYFLKPGRLFDATPALGRPVSFLFTREDITRQDTRTAAILEWNVTTLWRGREFYYLFGEGGGSYTLFPLGAFAGEEEREHFEALALAACPEMRMKRFG